MPRPRFNNLDADKQASILNAAFEAFSEHGFEDASYNLIIERAGISKGAMYYYFDDKEDLYSTVVRRELGDLMEGFESIPEAQNAEGEPQSAQTPEMAQNQPPAEPQPGQPEPAEGQPESPEAQTPAEPQPGEPAAAEPAASDPQMA